jgi:hypothetical protein
MLLTSQTCDLKTTNSYVIFLILLKHMQASYFIFKGNSIFEVSKEMFVPVCCGILKLCKNKENNSLMMQRKLIKHKTIQLMENHI